MRFIITLAFAYCCSSGIAQTPLIAHKSHAGASSSYDLACTSNFGQIQVIPETWNNNTIQSKPMETFIPLNDSVILKRTTPARSTSYVNFSDLKTDTLPNKNRYSVFVFRQKYEDSLQQLELEKYNLQLEKEHQQELKSQQPINQEPASAKKKKKKSYLLFLFGITGGGMMLMRLFTRSKTTQPSIA